MTPHEVEYISDAEHKQAHRLAGAISELLLNWQGNNKGDGANPFIIVGALGYLIGMCLRQCPDEAARQSICASVVDLILVDSGVDRAAVLRDLTLLSAEAGHA